MNELAKEWEEGKFERKKKLDEMMDYYEEIYQAKVQRAKIHCGDFS